MNVNEFERSDYAGFWRRFAAFIIDNIAVSLIVFPFAMAIALISPKSLLVQVPFDLFTTTAVVE